MSREAKRDHLLAKFVLVTRALFDRLTNAFSCNVRAIFPRIGRIVCDVQYERSGSSMNHQLRILFVSLLVFVASTSSVAAQQ